MECKKIYSLLAEKVATADKFLVVNFFFLYLIALWPVLILPFNVRESPSWYFILFARATEDATSKKGQMTTVAECCIKYPYAFLHTKITHSYVKNFRLRFICLSSNFVMLVGKLRNLFMLRFVTACSLLKMVCITFDICVQERTDYIEYTLVLVYFTGRNCFKYILTTL